MILFAGTTEGRELAEALAEREIETDVFVVSEYGEAVLPNCESLRIHVGRLDEQEMEVVFQELQPDLILDATHPYAAIVTENIHRAAVQTGFLYRRVYRSEALNRELMDQIEVSNIEEAVEYLEHTTGNLFVTTGSKELPAFTKLTNYQERVYARVLPTAAVAKLCEECGIKGRQLMMMQGPFSREMNELMLKETKAAYLVTKQSGRAGGFEEKCEAARNCGVKLVLIGRPKEALEPDEVITVENALELIRQEGNQQHRMAKTDGVEIVQKTVDIKYQKKERSTDYDRVEETKIKPNSGRKIMLIGMGPGDPALISEEAVRTIEEAELLIGAERMLKMGLKKTQCPKKTLKSYQNSEIRAFLEQHPEYHRIAFLYSGDIDIYSGAQRIREILTDQDEIREIHGISSVDYLANLCGRKRSELYLTSVHGRDNDVAGLLEHQTAVVCLLGGSKTFQKINREIIKKVYSQERNGQKLTVTLGERLSYPDERITRGLPENFLNHEIDSLSVALFEWKMIPSEFDQTVDIPRCLITAPKSGGGKTTVTCGLIRALQKRKLTVSSFKCGPDYIDPMFHASTLGVKTGNLDSFFTDASQLRTTLAEQSRGSDIAVLEGVMGYYDGLGGVSERASSCEIAEMTASPVILVIDAKGASVSLIPVLTGLLTYHQNSRIRGILLNRVSKGFYPRLKALLEEEFQKRKLNVEVLGYVPENPAFAVPSRHLGLVSPEELSDRRSWADGIADQLLESVDVDRILEIASEAPAIHIQTKFDQDQKNVDKSPFKNQTMNQKVRIAIAKDEAFSFYYSENEALLESLGAELVEFSPLHDEHFPKDVDGLILGGGYPELYPRELEQNETMRFELREAVGKGLPTIAECGGFLYLLKSLRFLDGTSYEMCGMIDAYGFETAHLVRFGYFEAETKQPGIFGKTGLSLRGHEFHYWDASENGAGLSLRKPIGERSWDAMFYTDTMAAGFPHFYYPGNPEAISHFLKTCEEYQARRFNERD